MGGWCSYKTARLLGRPGPPARSGRSQAFPPACCPAVPRGHPGLSRPSPRGRSARRRAVPLGPAVSRGGADTGGRAGRAAAGCSVVPAAGPAPRRELCLHKQRRGHRWSEEPVGSRSPWLGAGEGLPRESLGAGESPLGSLGGGKSVPTRGRGHRHGRHQRGQAPCLHSGLAV